MGKDFVLVMPAMGLSSAAEKGKPLDAQLPRLPIVTHRLTIIFVSGTTWKRERQAIRRLSPLTGGMGFLQIWKSATSHYRVQRWRAFLHLVNPFRPPRFRAAIPSAIATEMIFTGIGYKFNDFVLGRSPGTTALQASMRDPSSTPARRDVPRCWMEKWTQHTKWWKTATDVSASMA